mmetsp:Transcript_6036/g.13322  ORF Transcript_6036/g.13322 Transcript_6036/m.13322 type:complete len:468 (+) Transcript_6036:133-1536(+)
MATPVPTVRGVKRSCGDAKEGSESRLYKSEDDTIDDWEPSRGSRDSLHGVIECARTLEVSRAARARFVSLMADAAERLPPDVVLIAADGSRHSTHRLVLGAWSPFFRSMFCQGMLEQIQGEVKLPDVAPELLTAILEWMHGREVRKYIDSRTGLMMLLELAKRWEIDDLCEQLVMLTCMEISDATVHEFWGAADKLSVTSLANRCSDYVQTRLVSAFSTGGTMPTPLLRDLAPDRFSMLLESDSLPVQTEEQALDLALVYIEQHTPLAVQPLRPGVVDEQSQTDRGPAAGGQFENPEQISALSSLQLERILLAVRWRLVPSAKITEQAMRHPAVLDEGCGKPRPGPVAAAIADALQFHFLGGRAKSLLANARPLPLRASHRIPVPRYEVLSKGDPVRVIPSTDTLRELCKRPAPGCFECVGWTPGMEQLAGCLCNVHALDPETCAAQVEEHEHGYILPFDALLLANL